MLGGLRSVFCGFERGEKGEQTANRNPQTNKKPDKNSEAFVGPFDVANKTIEMLMMKHGVDVCCTSPEDAERIARYNDSMSSGDGG